jgi:hypothetical protein
MHYWRLAQPTWLAGCSAAGGSIPGGVTPPGAVTPGSSSSSGSSRTHLECHRIRQDSTSALTLSALHSLSLPQHGITNKSMRHVLHLLRWMADSHCCICKLADWVSPGAGDGIRIGGSTPAPGAPGVAPGGVTPGVTPGGVTPGVTPGGMTPGVAPATGGVPGTAPGATPGTGGVPGAPTIGATRPGGGGS